ncbi:MAG: MFS transporter [Telluria sp.]
MKNATRRDNATTIHAVPESARSMLPFAVMTCLLVLPLAASQAVLGLIARDLGVGFSQASEVTVYTFAGYALGLFFVIPLADFCDGRRLAVGMALAGTLALLGLYATHEFSLLLLLSIVSGVASSVVQVVVSVSAGLAREHERGRAIGTVMSGIMLGILLSRPLAAVISQSFGWRAVYLLIAAAYGGSACLLFAKLPSTSPRASGSYRALLGSMWGLLRTEPVLRSRALSQGLCMGAFGAFWTTAAMRLQTPPYSLSPFLFAVFCMAGAAGTVISPIAGRAADRGLSRRGLVLAHSAMVLGALLSLTPGVSFVLAHPFVALAINTIAAFVFDCGAIADQAIGRRAVNLLRPEARSRINGLYTGIFFLGNALGARLGGLIYPGYGWEGTCALVICFAIAAFICTGHRSADR